MASPFSWKKKSKKNNEENFLTLSVFTYPFSYPLSLFFSCLVHFIASFHNKLIVIFAPNLPSFLNVILSGFSEWILSSADIPCAAFT